MGIDRRSLLLGLGASGALSVTGFTAAKGEPAFVACYGAPDGTFGAAVLDEDANILFTESLDARGHDAAVRGDGRIAVVFARRPGRFAIVLDLVNRRRVLAFAPPENRHFYGHGFFSTDGRLLFATENDFDNERGVLGVYDVGAAYARIGEIETGGIGPHEAILMSDGRTAIVANGGIATHPDYPRQKLNLATMAPSIGVIDIDTGDVLEIASLPAQLHQLSIRHMAEAGDGSIWFGGQYEGAQSDLVPLVGCFNRDAGPVFVHASETLYRDMNQYVGSVAASPDGSRIATTSPRGGQVIIWDAVTRTPIETRAIPDVCGVAPKGESFALSDGQGGFHLPGMSIDHTVAWDNHLVVAATLAPA